MPILSRSRSDSREKWPQKPLARSHSPQPPWRCPPWPSCRCRAWRPCSGSSTFPAAARRIRARCPWSAESRSSWHLLAAAPFTGISHNASWFLLALSVVIAVGFWDDVDGDAGLRLKFLIEIVASAIMIWGAGVELRSVGDLLGWRPIGLWIFAVPMTMFAIVGVVNAVNMMDGHRRAGRLDRLRGVRLVRRGRVVSRGSTCSSKRRSSSAARSRASCCSTCACLGRAHARVFLGDAGSLMIGFALGWFAIDLTQGEGRTFPPIAALWVVLLPLADCVSLMARRLREGKSPFDGDRHHIHHYLLARGFSHNQVVAVLVGGLGALRSNRVRGLAAAGAGGAPILAVLLRVLRVPRLDPAGLERAREGREPRLLRTATRGRGRGARPRLK